MSGYVVKTCERLTEAELRGLWFKAEACGALALVACDFGVLTEDLFVIFARRADVFGLVSDGGGGDKGFFYLTDPAGASARIHFCLFEAGRDDRAAVGRAALDWCFESFGFLSLVGIVPVINQGAVGYARLCGGREMGILPGFCWIERLKRAVGGVQFLFLPRPPAGSGRRVCDEWRH